MQQSESRMTEHGIEYFILDGGGWLRPDQMDSYFARETEKMLKAFDKKFPEIAARAARYRSVEEIDRSKNLLAQVL